jgi:hypothetical protein
LELCLAALSRLVMDVTSRLDAASHSLWLGANEASRNATVYQWAEHSDIYFSIFLDISRTVEKFICIDQNVEGKTHNMRVLSSKGHQR